MPQNWGLFLFVFSKIITVVEQEPHMQRQERPNNYGRAESAQGQQNKEEEIACTDWLKYQVQRRRKHNLFIWKMTPVT